MEFKRTEVGVGHDRQVELKFGTGECAVHVIVGLDGWNYPQKGEFRDERKAAKPWQRTTKGSNVRVSMNGALKLTFDEWELIRKEIDLARYSLNMYQSEMGEISDYLERLDRFKDELLADPEKLAEFMRKLP